MKNICFATKGCVNPFNLLREKDGSHFGSRDSIKPRRQRDSYNLSLVTVRCQEKERNKKREKGGGVTPSEAGKRTSPAERVAL